MATQRFRLAPVFHQGRQFRARPFPGRSFCWPTACRRLVELGGVRAVIPPASIPHALEECPRVLGDEIDVRPQRCLQQDENTNTWMISGNNVDSVGERARQFESVSGLYP